MMRLFTFLRLRSFLLLVTGLAGLALSSYGQSISGTVFRDFNSNGTLDNPSSNTGVAAGETGVPGVVVTAYPTTGAPKSVTTSAAGTYTITGLTGQVRLEFTNLQAGDFDSFRGTGSATSVQFVTAGSTANFGINYPANYCQTSNPPLVTTCFVAINATNTPQLQNRAAMVGAPYTVVDTDNSEKDYATVGEIGAAWGLAYNKDTKQIFSSAFTKRHVGFAAGGPNAIYLTNVTSTSSGNTTPFFNFTTVGGTAVSSTTETHGNDLPSPSASPTNVQLASYDLPAFDAVGKTSLGDVDISDDNKTLYVVNLKDRKLYTIDIATKTAVGVAIPNPGCTTTGTTAGSYRPFAVKYYRGKVYVGVVCTREDLGTTRAAYGPTTGLSATVYAVDPATPSVFNTVLSFPLTYRKAPSNADILPATTATVARAEYWRPWTSVFQADRDAGGSTLVSYPQAWLTDIEFDVNGDMIVGLRDRFGDQIGFQNRRPIAGNPDLISAISPGEVLRARKCNPTDAQWTLESNGALCGGTPSAAQDAEQGPGGGKYYWGDRVQDGGNHGMSSQAGLALLPGSGKLAMTAIDPTEIFNTGGIKRLINATGAKDGNATGTTPNPNAGIVFYGGDAFSYGKANGLGDLEVLCNPAPVEIGNRVWRDDNNNGVQDPGEPVLPGVTVTLKGPGLTTAGVSVTTNSSGEYYFSSGPGVNTPGFVNSLTLTSGGSYTLSFPTSASAGALSLSSKPNSATGTNADAIDTDPSAAGVVVFTLGGSGENNFTYDAAYVPCVPPSVTLVASSNAVCVGQPVTLTTQVSAGGSFTVSAPVGVSLTGATTINAIAANLATGVNTFTVTASSSPGCFTTATVSVTVSAAPLITLTTSSSAICLGQTVSLSVAGVPVGGIVSFGTLGPLGTLINPTTSGVFSPTATTTFLASVSVPGIGGVLGSILNSCPATVAVNQPPVLPPLGLSVCVGTTLNLTALTGPGGSLSALNGLTNVFRLGNLVTGSVLTTPVSVSAGVNLFNVTSTSPLGCTTNAPISVTGVPGPVLPPLGLAICVGTSVDLTSLTGPGGSLSALNGLTNVFGLGGVPGGGLLNGPISVSAGVNLFNVTSTSPLGCTTNAPISVTGVAVPVLAPISLSLCVGVSLDLTSLTGLAGLTNVFRTGDVLGLGTTIGSPTSVSVGLGVNLFNVTSTNPTGCTAATPISVTGVNCTVCNLIATPTAGLCTTVASGGIVSSVFSLTVAVTLTNLTPGTLTITDGPRSLTFAVTSSITSLTGVFNNLIADGSTHTISASLTGCGSSSATYQAPGPCLVATPKLMVDKYVSLSRATVGAVLTYTVVLTNSGSLSAATTVRDSLSGGSTYVSGSASVPAGTTFTPGQPVSLWTVPSIAAGQSLTLTFQARADSVGILYNRATIPGDTASVCTSIPVQVCAGDQYTFRLMAPAGRSSYQWYKDNQLIAGATTNTLEVTTPGTYSLAVDNTSGQCPDFSCCPFVVEEVPNVDSFTLTATTPTCSGTVAQANGSITLSGLTSTTATPLTYQLAQGGTDFESGVLLTPTKTALPAGGVLSTSLAPGTYRVRVYNGAGCFRDQTVVVPPANCQCPPQACVPLVIQQTKRGPRKAAPATPGAGGIGSGGR